MTKKYISVSILILFISCLDLGYDNHTKPIPKQKGSYSSLGLGRVGDGYVFDSFSIESPINHESGWDSDDVVLVFKSELIKEETLGKLYWYSESSWIRWRIGLDPPFGYGGSLSCRVIDGEVRVYLGSRGQFLVNKKSIELILERK